MGSARRERIHASSPSRHLAGGTTRSHHRALAAAGVLLLLVALPGRAPQADEGPAPLPPHPLVQAASDLLEAAARSDADLAAELRKFTYGPWLLAEELASRGAWDDALRMAGLLPPPDGTSLAAYLTARRAGPVDAARWATLREAHARLAAEDPAGALTLLARDGPLGDDVPSLWGREIRALALRLQGAKSESRATFLEAAAAGDRVGWAYMAASSWWRAAMVALELQDLEGAVASFTEQMRVDAARGDWQQWAGALQRTGRALVTLGRRGESKRLLETGIAKLRALDLPKGEIELLKDFGSLVTDTGDFADGLSAYERVITLAETVGDRHTRAQACVLLGNLHARMDNNPEALRLQEQALAAFETAGNGVGALTALGNIGGLLVELGQHERGAAVLEDALARSRALGDRAAEARFLGNLAHLANVRGEPERALAGYHAEVAIDEALGDEYGLAIAWGNIGSVLENLGRPAEAIAPRERAIALAERVGDQETLVLNLSGLANLLQRTGKPTEALVVFERTAVEMTAMLRGLGEEEGARLRESLATAFRGGVVAAAAVEDLDAVWRFVERGRAAGLLEGLGLGGTLEGALLPADLREAQAQSLDAAQRTRQRLRAAREGGSAEERRAAKSAYEAALAERERVAERIQREHKRAAGVLYPQPAPLREVQALLEPQDALLLYVILQAAAACLVVTASEARFVRLPGTLDELEADADELRLRHADAPVTEPATRLADRLLAPLKLAAPVRRLLVSPHGSLSTVPFSLLDPDREFVSVPSGSALLALAPQRRARGRGVLAVGDPLYDRPTSGDGAARTAPQDRLAPLPGTRKEVEAVGDEVLLGAQATRSGLLAQLGARERWRAVHLACHGLPDLDRPALSALALTAEGDDDGRLRCLDVFHLRVPGDLVVLSACESGRGKVYVAEGVMGLTRAFFYAGAPRVISSLWKVDDEATQALMVKFYELWNPRAQPGDPERAPRAEGPRSGATGLAAAAALKQAQEHVRRQERWSHPYYWAAWVLWGLPD